MEQRQELDNVCMLLGVIFALMLSGQRRPTHQSPAQGSAVSNGCPPPPNLGTKESQEEGRGWKFQRVLHVRADPDPGVQGGRCGSLPPPIGGHPTQEITCVPTCPGSSRLCRTLNKCLVLVNFVDYKKKSAPLADMQGSFQKSTEQSRC